MRYMKMERHECIHMLLLFIILSPTLLPLAVAQQPSDDYELDNSSNNVSPTTAMIVIVLVLAFLITGCVSIYIQQCSDTASPSTSSPTIITGRTRRENVIRGLDQSVIETFPTFIYSTVKESKLGKGSLECAVCLSEFKDDETLCLLPKCDHVFHPQCIDTWLVGHTTCPVCRANLVPDPAQLGNSTESTHRVNSDSNSEEPSELRITIPDEIPKWKLFPRSNSTGHDSLSQPGTKGTESAAERFTLRLPAEVRRQLIAKTNFKRTTSLVVLPRETSSRLGYRFGGDNEGSGSSRYGRIFGRSNMDRWSFAPFGSRLGSFKLTAKVGMDGDLTAGSTGSKRILGTSVTPLESIPPV